MISKTEANTKTYAQPLRPHACFGVCWCDPGRVHLDDPWESERDEVITEFVKLLRGPTGDGSTKRQRGEKPSWKVDKHGSAAERHWRAFQESCWYTDLIDKDSGCHPAVHCAWRLLACAWKDMQHPEWQAAHSAWAAAQARVPNEPVVTDEDIERWSSEATNDEG